jgi:hypothetical protein
VRSLDAADSLTASCTHRDTTQRVSHAQPCCSGVPPPPPPNPKMRLRLCAESLAGWGVGAGGKGKGARRRNAVDKEEMVFKRKTGEFVTNQAAVKARPGVLDQQASNAHIPR